MKNSFKILAAMAILGLAGTASAQNSSSANGYASGTIISPIAINSLSEQGAGIGFGNIVNGNGDVTEAGGTNTFSVAGMQPGTQAGDVHDAAFVVTGQSGFTFAYNVAINGGGILGAGITLDAVTPATGTGTLTGGSAGLSFGGKITLNSASPGTFNVPNAFTVSVNYN